MYIDSFWFIHSCAETNRRITGPKTTSGAATGVYTEPARRISGTVLFVLTYLKGTDSWFLISRFFSFSR
jgi:hypothetical protein